MSVCPFVLLFTLSIEPTGFELEFLCAWVMTLARLELKVKVVGQGQTR